MVGNDPAIKHNRAITQSCGIKPRFAVHVKQKHAESRINTVFLTFKQALVNS